MLLDTDPDTKRSGPELAWSALLFSELTVAPVRNRRHLSGKESSG